jgi:predicted phage baseplate assembly protein
MLPAPDSDPDRAPPVLAHPARARDLAALLDARLSAAGFAPAGADPLRDALVHIGARYGEILARQLDAVPELHRRFLVERLGGRAGAALPAQVLLSFQPVAAPAGPSAAPVVVPSRTPVAAPPAPGETQPVVFETLDDLQVVRAQAVRAVAVDPRRGRWADLPALLGPDGGVDTDLFATAEALESTFRLAAPEVFDTPGLQRIELRFDVERDAGVPARAIATQWGVPSGDDFAPLAVERDGTGGFATDGAIVLTPPAHWPLHTIDGVAARWLACRAPPAEPEPGSAIATRAAALRIGRPRVSGRARLDGAAVDAAHFGAVPLDTGRDFLPLGERPRFNDVFQFTTPAFALPGARVTLTVRLTNPAGATDAPLPSVDPAGAPRLRWEIDTGGTGGWRALDAEDGTGALTRHGDIAFTVPPEVAPPPPDAGGDRPGVRVRARLVAGHYGAPRVVDGLPVQPAPSIESLRWRAEVEPGPVAPRHLGRQGMLEAAPLDATAMATAFFTPFPAADTDGPVLCLALASQERSLAGRTLSVQVEPGAPVGRGVRRSAAPEGGAPPAPPRAPTWQRRSADGWRDCAVVDGSAGLTRPGIVAIDLGEGPTAWAGSTLDPAGRLVWLRVVWPPDAPPPRLRGLALNAVRASQTLRLDNEVLGSAHGRPGQVFATLRAPVVGEPLLQVREDPAAADARAWVAWERVADFAGSAADARHFTLDAATGRIAFGDGRQGRIPPAGAGNVRLRRYDTGGGRRGNRPAGQVTQLRTTVPCIDAVRQLAPATGGQDGDDAIAVRDAAGAWLRHRDRAIAADDYADLARAASREVARAWCRAGHDLDGAAAAAADGRAPGVVSVVIVPTGDEARPQPAPDLLDRVTAYLDARRPVTAELVVLGPAYAAVSVEARIACADATAARGVAAACRQRLAAFLHPAHGAADTRGWAPGRRPHRSDLLAALGAVEGVDHVISLTLRIDEPADAAREAALVCAGALEVTTP